MITPGFRTDHYFHLLPSQRSRQLQWQVMLALQGLALLMAAGAGFPDAIFPLTVFLVAGACAWRLLRNATPPCGRYIFLREGQWHWLDAQPGAEAVLLTRAGPAVVLPWLVIIPFRQTAGPAQNAGGLHRLYRWLGCDRVLLVAPDSCPADTLRRLRVLLRWHAAI